MRRINKIMLVYPNQRWLKQDLTTTWNLSPYNICILATVLKREFEVKIVDAQIRDLSLEQFRNEIKDYCPDCVGVSLLTSEYAPILDMACEAVKEVDPAIVTMVGGVHATTQYMRVLDNPKIDYGVRGEGEYVLPQFLKYLNGEAEFPARGLIFRNDKGETEALLPDCIEDLDALPYPDYDLLDYPKYCNHKGRYGVDSMNTFPYSRILTSRGCPIGCCFCQVANISGKMWRARSAENVVGELEYLKARHGINGFYVDDDNAFVSKTRTKEILNLLKARGLNLKWKAAGVPIFKMDEETFALMAETGCEMIGVAIESGTKRVLKEVINKPVNLDLVPDLIASAKRHGIFVVANFVIGFPTETWEEIRTTLRFAESCGADYCKIYAAQPLLGTRLYELAKKTNTLVGDENVVDWRYGRIHTSEFTPQDIAILRAYEWDRINFSSPEKIERTARIMGITVDELNEIRVGTRKSLSF